MTAPKKLDWFPLYVHRLKASSSYKELTDFQFAWYMKLLIESFDSERSGYLPNDIDVLWQLAGARTKAYFQREGQSVLRRFQGRTADGRWIYNERMVQVLEEQAGKLRPSRSKKPVDLLEHDPPSSLLCSQVLDVAFEVEAFDFEKSFNELFKIYPRRVSGHLVEKNYCEAVERVAKRHGFSRTDAAAYILGRTQRYVSTCKFIAALDKYLYSETYEQDESMWESVVPAGNAKQRATQDAIDKAFS